MILFHCHSLCSRLCWGRGSWWDSSLTQRQHATVTSTGALNTFTDPRSQWGESWWWVWGSGDTWPRSFYSLSEEQWTPGAWILIRSPFHGQGRRVESSKCFRLGRKPEKTQKPQKTLTAVGRTCKLHPETPTVRSAVPRHPFKQSININDVPISDQISFYRFSQWILRCCWCSSKVKWCNRWGGCRSTSKASTDPIFSAISWGQRTVQSCVFGRLKERWEGAKPCRAQPSAGSRRRNEWCSDKTQSKEGSRPNRKTTYENVQGVAYLKKKKKSFSIWMELWGHCQTYPS